MEREFQEADVVWPEELQLKLRGVTSNNLPSWRTWKISDMGCKLREKTSTTSSPICIPSEVGGRSSQKIDIHDAGHGGAAGPSSVMVVPPHIMASKRRDEKVAYSLCFGNGRTLKGRDLRRVRNSVLRLTGFIEG